MSEALFFFLVAGFMFSHLVVGVYIFLKAKRSPRFHSPKEERRWDPFWQNFTGKETLNMLNRQVNCSPAFDRIGKIDFFINEIGMFFSIRNGPGDFVVRYSADQQFNLTNRVVDLLDCRIENDWVMFKLQKFVFWRVATEVTFSNISPNEREKIKYFIEKANWKKAPVQ